MPNNDPVETLPDPVGPLLDSTPGTPGSTSDDSNPASPWVWFAVVAVLVVLVVFVVYLLKRAFTRTNKVMAIVERKRLEAQSTVVQ